MNPSELGGRRRLSSRAVSLTPTSVAEAGRGSRGLAEAKTRSPLDHLGGASAIPDRLLLHTYIVVYHLSPANAQLWPNKRPNDAIR